jgi:hypothetical protein
VSSYRAAKDKLVAVALVLLGALAVANLVHNVESLRFEEGIGTDVARPPPFKTINIDTQTSMTLSVVLSILAGSIILVAYLRYRPKGRGFPLEELLPIVIFILIFLAFIFLSAPAQEVDIQEDAGEDTEAQLPDETGKGEPSGDAPLVVGPVPGLLGFLLVFFALSAAFLLMGSLRSRRARVPLALLADFEKGEEAVRALEEGIYRLRLGDDVRSVILKSYRDMVGLFRKRGVEAKPHLTARELEAEALERIGLSARSSKSLRELFELARYSRRPLAEIHREQALNLLQRVKRELEA